MTYRETCKGCKYHKHLSWNHQSNDFACHYSIDTEFLRPCPAERCTVKVTEKGKTNASTNKLIR